MSSHGANVDETVGARISAHTSSIVPVTTLTVAAVTQSNVNFSNPLVQNPWSFNPLNLRNQGWKIPKFTKFGGVTNESTVEDIARYLTEAGDIANNENLRMKFFPSSLPKSAFTWYTTLSPGVTPRYPKQLNNK
ncbi:hypothetical protein MTR_6g089370 [Medicago truncatula]|uniref:Uncharacterized protein n=1 Tax=Medicago truncatula TaxID=3880 RepID=G7KQE3_MEDTR|nr:hypothetical protein MTR_6g089370 [Medicago truncatula]